jgi:hypothetical protein
MPHLRAVNLGTVSNCACVRVSYEYMYAHACLVAFSEIRARQCHFTAQALIAHTPRALAGTAA